MSFIDLEALQTASIAYDPYDHVIVPQFLKLDAVAHIDADYPVIDSPGSHPLSTLAPGLAFAALMEELQGKEVQQAFSEKFCIDLSPYPTTVTVRGQCQEKDGAIHTDTPSKIVTVLIYMNTGRLANEGGRLRLLRSATDLSDYAAEIPPIAGTMLAFRRSDRSFHGHETFIGKRRVIQMNWVTSEMVVRRELRRHRLSAWAKSLLYAVTGKF